jgi:DNA helicase HerA-like ATPase
MPDYSLPNCITLIFGKSSSGKTTLAFRYLLNVPAACRFIFDDRGQAAQRLKLKACGTARECELALPTRWVCFNPHIMFPGHKLPDAFRWFLHWVFEVCKRGPGKKVLFVDELWQWADQRSMPEQLENVVRTGRTEGLELLSATHCPREYHCLIRSQCTEFIAFNTVEPAELDAIRPYWIGVERASALPRGHFLAYNRESGAELAGRLF